MQEQSDNSDAPPKAADTIDVSESQAWEQRIAIFFISAASIGILVCAGLLIQAYLTHKPVFELLTYSSFKPGFELLGYYASVFSIAGYLNLIIAAGIYALGGIKQKQLSYIPGFISAALMLLSFWLWFFSHQLGSEWWGYFVMAFVGINIITMIFSTLVGTEQKRLRKLLEFIKYILVLTILALIFWETETSK